MAVWDWRAALSVVLSAIVSHSSLRGATSTKMDEVSTVIEAPMAVTRRLTGTLLGLPRAGCWLVRQMPVRPMFPA